MERSRIPVTIITGFLGAGKTTLINEMIRNCDQKKFAIIENEFGEIGIDGALIMNTDEKIFELSNGCICCSLSDDFYQVLIDLIESPYEFNHLLIETTGIADPTSIIQAFVASPEVQATFYVDSVICLADATYIEDLLDEQPEAQLQLGLADIVLLNKADSIREGYADTLTARLKQLNPMAQFHTVSYCSLEGLNLLDVDAYSTHAVERSTLSFFPVGKMASSNESSNNSVLMQNQSHTHHHHHDICAEGFWIKGLFNPQKFNLWMHSFLYFNPSTVFRVKGIVCFSGETKQFIFQAVREKYTLEPGKQMQSVEPMSKLVFIGKQLDRKELEKNLNQLLENKE